MKLTAKHLIMTFASCFLPILLVAQQDSLDMRQRIMESEDTDQMLIQKARNVVFNNLRSNNIDEAQKVYDYTIGRYKNELTPPFFFWEKSLLGFWFGKYEILYDADSLEYAYETDSREYIYPVRDKLTVELRRLCFVNRTMLLQRIDSLAAEEEKREYLKLFFDWLTFDAADPELSENGKRDYLQKELTPKAEEFLSFYKDSRFRPFVQRHFRHVYLLRDWGLGYELGLGLLNPQSTVGQYLQSEITIGLGVGFSWKNVLFDAGYDIGVPVEMRRPFIHSGQNWNTDIRHNYMPFFITGGWVAEETKSFKLIPHLGIGGFSVSAAEAYMEKPGGDVSMTQTMMLYGVTCDIKLSSGDYCDDNIYSYTGVRFGLDYLQFLGNDPILSGGMLRMRISWVSFGRSIVRDM